jgi:hypothetical protein
MFESIRRKWKSFIFADKAQVIIGLFGLIFCPLYMVATFRFSLRAFAAGFICALLLFQRLSENEALRKRVLVLSLVVAAASFFIK